MYAYIRMSASVGPRIRKTSTISIRCGPVSERIACEACGGAIDPRPAVCPLCGHARRPRATVSPTSLETPSEDSVRPLLPRFETRPAAIPVHGPIDALRAALVPAPHTRGWMRFVELALTPFASPVFLAATPVLALVVRRWTRPGPGAWLAGAAVATAGWIAVERGLGLDEVLSLKLMLVALGAWALRSVVRALSARRDA